MRSIITLPFILLLAHAQSSGQDGIDTRDQQDKKTDATIIAEIQNDVVQEGIKVKETGINERKGKKQEVRILEPVLKSTSLEIQVETPEAEIEVTRTEAFTTPTPTPSPAQATDDKQYIDNVLLPEALADVASIISGKTEARPITRSEDTETIEPRQPLNYQSSSAKETTSKTEILEKREDSPASLTDENVVIQHESSALKQSPESNEARSSREPEPREARRQESMGEQRAQSDSKQERTENKASREASEEQSVDYNMIPQQPEPYMPGSPDDQRQYNPSQERQWDPQSYNLYQQQQQQQQQQWESSYGQYPQQYWVPPTQAYDQAQSQQYGPSGQQYSNLQATQAASAMQGEQYGEQQQASQEPGSDEQDFDPVTQSSNSFRARNEAMWAQESQLPRPIEYDAAQQEHRRWREARDKQIAEERRRQQAEDKEDKVRLHQERLEQERQERERQEQESQEWKAAQRQEIRQEMETPTPLASELSPMQQVTQIVSTMLPSPTPTQELEVEEAIPLEEINAGISTFVPSPQPTELPSDLTPSERRINMFRGAEPLPHYIVSKASLRKEITSEVKGLHGAYFSVNPEAADPEVPNMRVTIYRMDANEAMPEVLVSPWVANPVLDHTRTVHGVESQALTSVDDVFTCTSNQQFLVLVKNPSEAPLSLQWKVELLSDEVIRKEVEANEKRIEAAKQSALKAAEKAARGKSSWSEWLHAKTGGILGSARKTVEPLADEQNEVSVQTASEDSIAQTMSSVETSTEEVTSTSTIEETSTSSVFEPLETSIVVTSATETLLEVETTPETTLNSETATATASASYTTTLETGSESTNTPSETPLPTESVVSTFDNIANLVAEKVATATEKVKDIAEVVTESAKSIASEVTEHATSFASTATEVVSSEYTSATSTATASVMPTVAAAAENALDVVEQAPQWISTHAVAATETVKDFAHAATQSVESMIEEETATTTSVTTGTTTSYATASATPTVTLVENVMDIVPTTTSTRPIETNEILEELPAEGTEEELQEHVLPNIEKIVDSEDEVTEQLAQEQLLEAVAQEEIAQEQVTEDVAQEQVTEEVTQEEQATEEVSQKEVIEDVAQEETEDVAQSEPESQEDKEIIQDTTEASHDAIQEKLRPLRRTFSHWLNKLTFGRFGKSAERQLAESLSTPTSTTSSIQASPTFELCAGVDVPEADQDWYKESLKKEQHPEESTWTYISTTSATATASATPTETKSFTTTMTEIPTETTTAAQETYTTPKWAIIDGPIRRAYTIVDGPLRQVTAEEGNNVRVVMSPKFGRIKKTMMPMLIEKKDSNGYTIPYTEEAVYSSAYSSFTINIATLLAVSIFAAFV